jgi:hypothetical protein
MTAAKPATRIITRGKGHSYLLDGKECPGVTTILDNGVPKPALVGWAAGTVADYVVNRLTTARGEGGKVRIVADELVRDALEWNATRDRPEPVSDDPLPRLALANILKALRYRTLQEAGLKGGDVHRFAQRLIGGEEVLVPKHLEGHVLSYVRFLEEWQPRDVLVEFVVVNRRWGYMGRGDLIATFDGVWSSGPWEGRPVGTALLDVKTARSGIFAEVALQLAGYKNGETLLHDDGTEEPMPHVDWCGAIHVRADGYDVIPMNVDDGTFRAFLYAKHLGEWLDFKNGPAATVKHDIALPPTRSTP